jgi:DNA-binding Lrp family transcriptional regulator
MEAKAYVLIEAESGQIGDVITALRTGPYDIIATVQTADPREIGRLVMHEIHAVEGIKRTVTSMVIG